MSINDVYDTIRLCVKILNTPDDKIDLNIQEVRLRLEEVLDRWATTHSKCDH